MGILSSLFKKSAASPLEPPIPEEDKKYYRPDNYYTNVVHAGTQFERKVITFEERKKISYPSARGLYVAEILLLEYCSYGTYPHPRNGYPGLWWFEYGIKNVGYHLSRLEKLGYIQMNEEKGKYYLTELGEIELGDNLYVPYMHKHKKKTTENTMFGPEFNVWSVNRAINKQKSKNWETIVREQEAALDAAHR